MVRFPLLFLILLTTFGLPRGAGAQGVFDFEPDTLFYTDGFEEVIATNVTADSVTIDSMSMRWQEDVYHHWYVLTDSAEYEFGHIPPQSDTTHTIEATILPSDEWVIFIGFDPCPPCGFSGERSRRTNTSTQADTLVFHSNGLVANDTLILDWAGLIADEEGLFENPRGIQLNVHPNPTTHRLHIALALESSTDVSVSVFDTRGRRISVLQNGPLTSGDHTLMWDSSETAPGVYAIRVETEDTATSKTVTITH